MNGVHEMGGRHGLGPVGPEPREPVFHEPWEGRVFALRARTARWLRGRDMGSHRFELERIAAADYLRMSYYARWFTVLVDRLLRCGLIATRELERGAADAGRPQPTLLPPSAGDQVSGGRLDVALTPRFRPAQPVRARNMYPRGHTRLPRYARGKLGTVVRTHGIFALQDTDETGQRLGDYPQHVYTVRFTARELWGDQASDRDSVYVDLWEGYLEPA